MLSETEETEATTPGTPADAETAIDEDGYIYLVEGGEVVGRVGDDAATWRATDAAAVDWALGVRAEIEADLAAVRLREKAVMDNFARLRRKQEQRLAWWAWRFQPDVVAYARRELAGGKARSLQLVNGVISFRKTPGTNRITDDEKAVQYVEERDPLRIKVVRSVTTIDVMKVAAENGDDPSALTEFIHSTGPHESIKVETGVLKG